MQLSVCSILNELYSVDASVRALERRQAAGLDSDPAGTDLRQLRERRTAAAARLPSGLATHYGRLCGGRPRPIATVSGGHCSGCQLRVPSQLESSSRSGDGYLICPHCQRILFFAEAGHEAAR